MTKEDKDIQIERNFKMRKITPEVAKHMEKLSTKDGHQCRCY